MNLEMHPQYVTSIKGKYHDYLYIEGQSLTSGENVALISA